MDESSGACCYRKRARAVRVRGELDMIEMNFRLSMILACAAMVVGMVCFITDDYEQMRFFFIFAILQCLQNKLEEIEKRLNDLSKK